LSSELAARFVGRSFCACDVIIGVALRNRLPHAVEASQAVKRQLPMCLPRWKLVEVASQAAGRGVLKLLAS
jgi:hypothetical protein